MTRPQVRKGERRNAARPYRVRALCVNGAAKAGLGQREACGADLYLVGELGWLASLCRRSDGADEVTQQFLSEFVRIPPQAESCVSVLLQ